MTRKKHTFSSDSMKTDEDLFKISSLDDDLSVSQNSVSQSKQKNSSLFPSRKTSVHRTSETQVDIEREVEFQQQQYLKTAQHFAVPSGKVFDDETAQTSR